MTNNVQIPCFNLIATLAVVSVLCLFARTTQADTPQDEQVVRVTWSGARTMPESVFKPVKMPTQSTNTLTSPEIDLPDDGSLVHWTQAHEHINQEVTVRGKIVDTHSTGRVIFLNYAPQRQNRFYIIVFADAFAELPDNPEQYFLNKTIDVSGKITEHTSNNITRPQIQVRDAKHIKVVE